MGWLGPLVLNFAWYANVFLLVALGFLLGSQKKATATAVIAALLSLDTLRFDTLVLDEGGRSTPIYGFGWGALLWFVAISLTLAAAGARIAEFETASGTPARPREFGTFVAGLAGAGIAILGALFFAVYDRSQANPAEKQRLHNLVFKRGPVCSTRDPVPAATIAPEVELKLADGSDSPPYPFNSPEQLLSWGVPVVRVEGLDYSIATTKTGPQLIAVEAAKRIFSVLRVGQRYAGSIHTALSSAEGRTAFDQQWISDKSSFCPDYSSFPKRSQQPRKVLMESLGLATASPVRDIVGMYFPKDTQYLSGQLAEPSGELQDLECPAGVGFGLKHGAFERDRQTHFARMRKPFFIGETAYYPGVDTMQRAVCVNGFAYLYGGTESSGNYAVQVEKHSLDDFSRIWTRVVSFARGPNVIQPQATTIARLEEREDTMEMDLVQEPSGARVTVRAQLEGKPR